MQNITNIYNATNENLLKITEKSYIECIYIDNTIYIASLCENNAIIRLSQNENNIFIQTKKCKIIFENLTDGIICREYLRHKDINDFLFFDDLLNNAKFIIIFNNYGFDINFNIYDNNNGMLCETEKIYIDKNIDLNFDTKFIKNIIDTIITNTICISHENDKYNEYFKKKTKNFDVVNLETEIRFNIKYDEHVNYFNITILLIKEINKIKMKETENANVNLMKKLNSQKYVCKCGDNMIENMIEQYNNEIVFEISKQYVTSEIEI
jgi:hypothetical protein